MIRVTVLYPNTGNSHFDKDYYLKHHAVLVRERLGPLGLQRIEVDEGIGSLAPDGKPLYHFIGYMVFDTLEGFQKGLAQHGAELVGDIPNYTDAPTQIQINQMVVTE